MVVETFFYLDYNHRQENAVECIYAKMMQMHHRAPIVNISIIDRNGPISVYDESSQSNTHQLIVTTEEQIKGTVHKTIFEKNETRKSPKLTPFFSDTMIYFEPNSICPESLGSCLLRGQKIGICGNNPSYVFPETFL